MPLKSEIVLNIPSGTFRHPISIVTANTANTDAYGTPVVNSVYVCNTKASIMSTTSLSYRELVTAQSISSSVTDLIVIRYPGSSVASIEPGMTVLHGNNTYTIQAVDNILERNRYLNLMCKSIDKSSNYGPSD